MRRAVAGALLLLLSGACTGAPMSREEARDFTERALRAAEVEIDGRTSTESKNCGRTEVPGWSTKVAADDGSSVELCVSRRGDRAVFVRDVGPGGVGPLLSDEQFERLRAFRYDPVGARRDRVQDRLSVVAAVLLIGASVALVLLNRRGLLTSARSS